MLKPMEFGTIYYLELESTLAHMLLYNLTPKLFGKFCIQSFDSRLPLHSHFIRNFQIQHANHINTFCTTSIPFLIVIGLKTLTVLKNLLEK